MNNLIVFVYNFDVKGNREVANKRLLIKYKILLIDKRLKKLYKNIKENKTKELENE